MHNRTITWLCISACLGFVALAANASSADYDKAVATYLEDKYEQAKGMFESLSKTEPKNDKVHYYLALCYQQLDNDKDAAEQYRLSLKQTKDPAFKEIIQERLRRTERRLSHGKAAPEQLTPVLKKHQPLAKVIWFSTNWCGTCKRFEPSWDAATKKFDGKITFSHLNAEDPANYKEVEKYRPKAYPTLVYLDGKNKVIENNADAPKPANFEKHLQDLSAGK